MKKITVTVDDQTYRLAHFRAAKIGRSVSAEVERFLNKFAPEDRGIPAQMPVRVPSSRGGEGQDEGVQGVQDRALDKGASS